ncbi:4-hydroxy-3-methylbut-2-en-1-yl diphosphate synthase [Escherichia coli]|uniref:4-hydroxy-3-methylbut-2-en-1-yl diphosphate synthase n=1 Tax=Escherichia coli TaxID=562 RepID=A0A376REQ9_ECOLX|nr:4-hydroxy-3-methylbut-2-en-1-yl diphosphate synthase [Escherichia coli]
MRHVDHLDRLNFDQFKVSVKASDVFLAVESYRLLAKQIDQPLHLGITEAGGARSGAVKSAIGLGLLLSEGIGDTLRVSLAADPVEEIKVGFRYFEIAAYPFRAGSTSSPARPVRVRNLMLSVRLTRWSNAWKISSLRWTFRLSAAW